MLNETHPDAPQHELEGVEVHGVSRGTFILRGALAAGAVYGSGMVVPFVSQALAQTGGGDVAILNFALTLEYLESAFYKKGVTLNLSSTVKTVAKTFGEQEAEHVSAIEATIKKLGGKPVSKPTFSFPIKDEASFLKLAGVLEGTGVGAYNAAGPLLKSKDVLAAAGSIVQIEARHAAIIRGLRKEFPAPLAFDKAIPMAQVLTAVKPLIKA